MATQVQMRRGTEEENDVFTGAEGEITIDTTNDTIRVHDGAKTGGYRVMKGNSPIVPGTYTKITFDKNGLVTRGEPLSFGDLPRTDLDRTYISKPSGSRSGTFTKVVVDDNGTVAEGTVLSQEDIPEIPVSKTTGLEAALDAKAPLLKIQKKENASGVIELSEGPSAITLSASCTLVPPIVTDNTVLRQCLVQIQKALDEYTITINANKFFGGVRPDLSSSGVYNIYFEYDVPTASWVYGAIKKS